MKMTKTIKRFFILCVVFLLFTVLSHAEIYKLRIDGPIETITEEYITGAFNIVKKAGSNAMLVIIQIDTPGGLSTSMQTIVKEILASPVPVAVYVSPRGAQAASAGFFITMAADIAVMAPATNTGAAHPVSITGSDLEGTMKDKVTNNAVSYIKSLAEKRKRNIELAEKAVSEGSKSYTAEECLKNNLIEYIAEDIENLLKQLEGKIITMADGKSVTLELKNQKIITLDMSSTQKFLKTITNPNLAYFLLIFGLIGLYIEFTHPGTIIPGVLGGICLLLAFLAFQVLPINYVGLLLILLSIGFFIAEIKVQGFGMLGIGGTISFVLGSIMLIKAPIPEMRPAMVYILSFATGFAIIFLFLTYKVIQVMKNKTKTGQDGLKEEIGVAKTDINRSSGKVFVHGEWWNAVSVSGGTIPAGSNVKIESIDGFLLKVKSTSTPIGG
jgi:membrane-bound serine protease (ClpP class)